MAKYSMVLQDGDNGEVSLEIDSKPHGTSNATCLLRFFIDICKTPGESILGINAANDLKNAFDRWLCPAPEGFDLDNTPAGVAGRVRKITDPDLKASDIEMFCPQSQFGPTYFPEYTSIDFTDMVKPCYAYLVDRKNKKPVVVMITAG